MFRRLLFFFALIQASLLFSATENALTSTEIAQKAKQEKDFSFETSVSKKHQIFETLSIQVNKTFSISLQMEKTFEDIKEFIYAPIKKAAEFQIMFRFNF